MERGTSGHFWRVGARCRPGVTLSWRDPAPRSSRRRLPRRRARLAGDHDGVLGADGRLRCVTNRIDGADQRWLRLRFDPPSDCTALEGVGGEGDSGGPALLRDGDRLTVAGVSSWQDHDGPLGTYGCAEHYVPRQHPRGLDPRYSRRYDAPLRSSTAPLAISASGEAR
jgi:hypothetical protein